MHNPWVQDGTQLWAPQPSQQQAAPSPFLPTVPPLKKALVTFSFAAHAWHPTAAINEGADWVLRTAAPPDYWPLADLHCEVFMPDLDKSTWKGGLSRIDRLMALQMNRSLEIRKVGRWVSVQRCSAREGGACAASSPQHGAWFACTWKGWA